MKKRIIVSVVSVLLAIGAGFFVFQSVNTAPSLSEAEAAEKVINLYGGELESTDGSGNRITVDFINSQGRYRAEVDKNTGSVDSVELLESAAPAKNISEQEAEEIALAKADGEITESTYSSTSNEYAIKVAGADGIYILAISGETGEVRKITAEEVVEVEPVEEPDRVISGDEAIAIARETLDGEVQEVEYVETADGGYYLVEIENDATDQEATMQIHAIRGETLTVDWDD